MIKLMKPPSFID